MLIHVSEWAEREIKYIRAHRWMAPAIVVSIALWALLIWGCVSLVRWVL